MLRGLRDHLQRLGIFFHGKVVGPADLQLPSTAQASAQALGATLANAARDWVVDTSEFLSEWRAVSKFADNDSSGAQIHVDDAQLHVDFEPGEPGENRTTSATTPFRSAMSSRTTSATTPFRSAMSSRTTPATTPCRSTTSTRETSEDCGRGHEGENIKEMKLYPVSRERQSGQEQRPTIDQPGFQDPVVRRAQREFRPLGESENVQRLAQDLRGEPSATLAPDLRRELYRLHRNLGHPDQQAFVRALKHAGAREEVVEWAKRHFHCPLCEGRQRPTAPRPGHLARALEFNQVVGVDTFFLTHVGTQHSFLNCVCWGTGLQVVEEIKETTAKAAFEAFGRCWLKPFGTPMVLVVDQGPEYMGKEFKEQLGAMGIMIHFTDARSPWQAARTEKAGGVFKDKLRLVLEETQATSPEDFERCVVETQVARNRYYHRSGFSPYQRVFGFNPRLPGSLASDDILHPILLHDNSTEQVRRSWEIRSAAAQAWTKQMDTETVKRGLATKTRTSDVRDLNMGDWVFVWRQTPSFKGWSGPGVLLAHSPNERSLWVSLRGHLVKVSREQVRRATSEENLGAELIKELSEEMVKDINHGKIKNFTDIQHEGNPEPEDTVTVGLSPIVETDDQELEITRTPGEPPEPLPAPMDVEDAPDSEGGLDDLLGPMDGNPMENVEMPGGNDDVESTRAPLSSRPLGSEAPTPSATTSVVPTPTPSRRTSIRVDEARDGMMRWGPVRTASTTSSTSAMPYPFSGSPDGTPSAWPAPPTSSQYCEVVDFDKPREKNVFLAHADGGMWWRDHRLQGEGLTALNNDTLVNQDAEASFSYQDKCIYLTKTKMSPGQITFSKLSEKHRKVFQAAREKEVKLLLDNKAIKILSVEESRQFRRNHPDYVLSSRYVDRWKPDGDKFAVLPEAFDRPGFDPAEHDNLSAKSRWCVVGWKDPMIHEIERSAPTPLTTSLYGVLQISASRSWTGYTKDVKTAFLQSRPTTRKQLLAVEMPPGEPFPGYNSEQLVMLLTEVYGLVSGPAWWRRSLLEILVKQLNYRINSYDRCVLTLDSESRGPEAKTEGIIVIEVDDLFEAGGERHRRNMEWLAGKLRFGKSVNLQQEVQGTGYAGRRIWQRKNFGYQISMDDYVQNRLKPVTFQRTLLKKDALTTLLNESEQSQLRGTIASINWAAREGRPDASAAASILAAAFPSPVLQHALDANKVVARMKSIKVNIIIHPMPEHEIRHLLICDSSFDPTGRTKPQHGWLQGITTPLLNQRQVAPVSLLAWRSRRLRRKAGSTMLCESVSLASALGALEKQVAFFESLMKSRFSPRNITEMDDDPKHSLRGKHQ